MSKKIKYIPTDTVFIEALRGVLRLQPLYGEKDNGLSYERFYTELQTSSINSMNNNGHNAVNTFIGDSFSRTFEFVK